MISLSNKWCYILSMRNIVVILFFLFVIPVLTEDLSGEFFAFKRVFFDGIYRNGT